MLNNAISSHFTNCLQVPLCTVKSSCEVDQMSLTWGVLKHQPTSQGCRREDKLEKETHNVRRFGSPWWKKAGYEFSKRNSR